jgi:hypothetical protein
MKMETAGYSETLAHIIIIVIIIIIITAMGFHSVAVVLH